MLQPQDFSKTVSHVDKPAACSRPNLPGLLKERRTTEGDLPVPVAGES